jgi:hypothetical protein
MTQIISYCHFDKLMDPCYVHMCVCTLRICICMDIHRYVNMLVYMTISNTEGKKLF